MFFFSERETQFEEEKTNSHGLQPASNGLQPTSDGGFAFPDFPFRERVFIYKFLRRSALQIFQGFSLSTSSSDAPHHRRHRRRRKRRRSRSSPSVRRKKKSSGTGVEHSGRAPQGGPCHAGIGFAIWRVRCSWTTGSDVSCIMVKSTEPFRHSG